MEADTDQTTISERKMQSLMRRKKQRGQLSCNKAVDVSPPGVVAERL
jgi:hypothetical protein